MSTLAPEGTDTRPPPDHPRDATEVAAASTAEGRAARRRRRQAATGSAPADRADRFLLALFGLVAVGLGTVALLARNGTLDLRSPGSLYDDAVRSAIDHQEVWTGVAVAAAVVVAVLGLVWAWVQVRLRPERGRLGQTVMTRGPRGRTSLAPSGVARVLAADVARIDGVTDASARLTELRPVPEVLVSVELRADADLRAVRRALEAPLARMAASIGAEAVDAELRVRIGDAQAARVV